MANAKLEQNETCWNGTKRYKGGLVYTGSFLGKKRHGQGRMDYPSGAFYEGEWRDNKRHGHGKYDYSDGRLFEGEWRRNLKYFGKFVYRNGNSYEGMWKGNMKHGQGRFTWKATNECYEGEFDQGKKHGPGEYRYPDGRVERGSYREDTAEGVWILTHPDGTQAELLYENDRIVRQKSIDLVQEKREEATVTWKISIKPPPTLPKAPPGPAVLPDGALPNGYSSSSSMATTPTTIDTSTCSTTPPQAYVPTIPSPGTLPRTPYEEEFGSLGDLVANNCVLDEESLYEEYYTKAPATGNGSDSDF